MRDEELLEYERRAYLAEKNRRRDRKYRREKMIAGAISAFLYITILAVLVYLTFIATAADAAKHPCESKAEQLVSVSEEDSYTPELTLLGSFTVTHYCPCSRCCGKWADGITATGTVATEGRTIAVDPDVIPLGSRVALFYDDGRISYYIAEDTGSQILGNKIDVCIADHTRARELGVTGASVYIVNEVA